LVNMMKGQDEYLARRLSEIFKPTNILVIYPPRQERLLWPEEWIQEQELLGYPQPLSKKVTSIFAARKPKTPET
jgi:hypothetical protein